MTLPPAPFNRVRPATQVLAGGQSRFDEALFAAGIVCTVAPFGRVVDISVDHTRCTPEALYRVADVVQDLVRDFSTALSARHHLPGPLTLPSLAEESTEG